MKSTTNAEKKRAYAGGMKEEARGRIDNVNLLFYVHLHLISKQEVKQT